MSESAPAAQNKTVVILLGVIAALLAVIVVVFLVQGSSGSVPEPTVSTPAPTQQTSTGQQAGTAAPPTDFDPTTAPAVAEGELPEDYVTAYYESVLAGDWEDAYYRQPTANLQGSVDAFREQLTGYGIAGYTIVNTAEEGEQYIVIADQQTAGFGTFENQWVFVQHEGAWVVASKAVTGMK